MGSALRNTYDMLTAQENRSVLKAVGFAGVSEYFCFATRAGGGGAKKRREDEMEGRERISVKKHIRPNLQKRWVKQELGLWKERNVAEV